MQSQVIVKADSVVRLKQIKNALIRRLYFRNPLNIYLGQKCFGNDSGLIANLVGQLVLQKDRLCSRLSPKDSGLASECKQLHQQGWVKLEGIDFSDSLVSLSKKFEDYCQSNIVPDSQRLEASTIGCSDDFFARFPEVKSILTTKLKAFIEQYYQSHFQILNVHLYRIFPVPQTLSDNKQYRPYGATACWHNDGSTVESIKMFVLLDEVDESQGPMFVIGSDETKDIIRAKYFQYQQDGLPGSDLEKSAKITKFTGQAGTVLFANPNTCLHRASIPTSGKHRDMLVFYLTSNHKPLDQDWHKKAIYQQCFGFSRLLNRFAKSQ